MTQSIEVYVVTHKPIDFPLPDYCKKIQVNAEANGQWPGYLHDNDSPDNISAKNPNYCELTALYSMWKNCKSDIQGLYHYRRYITGAAALRGSQILTSPFGVCRNTITQREIIEALQENDVILTSHYMPYPMNALEDLRRYVYWDDIKVLQNVIREYYPDYLRSLEYIFSLQYISYCNMFIARRDFVDGYCAWLFDVLGEVEKRISVESYDTQHKRACAFMAEPLLNVYVHRHNLRTKYFRMSYVASEKPLRHAFKKIPLLAAAVHAFRECRIRFSAKRTKTETENFYVSVARYPNHYGKCFIASFTPKNPDNFIHDLESALPEFESRAKSEGMIFAPRVILSTETPESVRKSLFELGVRVIKR